MYLRNKLYKIKKRYWNKLSVLCYHRIENYNLDPTDITVNKENFYNHINWLKKNTCILTPSEFRTILLERGSFPKRSILITFDDGYSSYFDTMKYLKEESIKAIFFISTPSKVFFWDTLKNILISPEIIRDNHYNFFCKTFDILKVKINIEKSLDRKSIEKINKWKVDNLNYPFERCRAFLLLSNILEQENPYPLNSLYNLLSSVSRDAPSLKNIFKSGGFSDYHSIGCHTSNHFNLSQLTHIQQKFEIENNKKKLEIRLDRNIEHFAYPYGTKIHYNKDSIKLVKRNFKFSFSNFPGKIHKDSNYFELPRFLVRDWDVENFKAKIENIFRF